MPKRNSLKPVAIGWQYAMTCPAGTCKHTTRVIVQSVSADRKTATVNTIATCPTHDVKLCGVAVYTNALSSVEQKE